MEMLSHGRRGVVRRGLVRQVQDRRGKAWRRGRHGPELPGMVRYGREWQGRRGEVRSGEAMLGVVMRGASGHGSEMLFQGRRGYAWMGEACPGEVWQARRGVVRNGPSRNG